MTDVHSLPEEMHEKWHRLIDGLNHVVEDLFSDDEAVAIVLGAQWGRMGSKEGKEEGLPTCVVTSNLPVCATPEAIEDMLDYAKKAHDEVHEDAAKRVEDGTAIKVDMDDSLVPEEVKVRVLEWAEKMGLKAENIQYVQVADVSDLAGLPTFEVNETGGRIHQVEGRVEASSGVEHHVEDEQEGKE